MFVSRFFSFSFLTSLLLLGVFLILDADDTDDTPEFQDLRDRIGRLLEFVFHKYDFSFVCLIGFFVSFDPLPASFHGTFFVPHD